VNTSEAARGSTQMFASAAGVTLPPWANDPPISAKPRKSCGSLGSSRSASAMFVSGPVATRSTSPGCSRAEPTITSTAVRSDGAAEAGGGAARPSPRSPWTIGNGMWSRASGRAAPCATSTSPRPAASSTASVFSVARSTEMFPITEVAPIRSTSDDATA
jgi:hypothetical protein